MHEAAFALVFSLRLVLHLAGEVASLPGALSEPGHSSEEEKTETALVFEEHNGEHKNVHTTQPGFFIFRENDLLNSSL